MTFSEEVISEMSLIERTSVKMALYPEGGATP
jgi:hypothetical protein